jgi:hypothetical protein
VARRFYVDTSAYLCILLGEAGGRELAKDLSKAELLSSSLLVLEAHRNLVRLSREGVLTASRLRDALDRLEEDVERFVLRDLTLDLCSNQAMPVVSTPRSLDLVHLRTALWFHESSPLSRFVTVDRSQRDAARELRLPIS